MTDHSFSDWKTDAEKHWKECTTPGCNEKQSEAAHDFKWVVDREATKTETGLKHEECKTCGHKKEAVVIPAGTAPGTGDPSDPDDPNKPSDPGAPDTGDSMTGFYIALMLIGAGAFAGTMLCSKKRKVKNRF